MYCNGDTSRPEFDARLDFKIKLIPYRGNDGWIPKAIEKLWGCLRQDDLPAPGADCDYCKYRMASANVEI